MRAISYSRYGDSSVLALGEAPELTPGPGEVTVSLERAGVNPTDWKRRSGATSTEPLESPTVPGQDGTGVITAVGPDVRDLAVGERVWLWLAAYQGPRCGTAQQSVTLPASQAVPLPDQVSFEVGAALGVPFLTAHRCLTLAEGAPVQLGPGTLAGTAVLVAGGAGAVGNAAIQLARWAGAEVITTVSSATKGQLATAAGAHHVIDYRQQDVIAEVRRVAPDGVASIVEVSPSRNLSIDTACLSTGGTVAVYADGDGPQLEIPVRQAMNLNARWHFVLLYSMPMAAKQAAVAGVSAALRDGAIGVGESRGLPLLHFPLAETAAAHDAVEAGTVGKVLIDVNGD